MVDNLGFPMDDCCSLGQLASGSYEDLQDIFYSHQFVQNDTTEADPGKGKETVHSFCRGKLLKGTVVGTIYRGSDCVQTFTVCHSGSVQLTDIGNQKVKAVGASMNHEDGKLVLHWNEKPGSCHVVASYEYNMDATYKRPSLPKNEAEFVPPTFKTFFDSEGLADIAKTAGTVAAWDFLTALGDTIKEKYESLYVKCHELTSILLRKGAKGYFWIATSPEVASIFETATAGFWPISSREFQDQYGTEDLGVAPLGLPQVTYRGSVNYRWRLYADTMMPQNMVLIGCNDKKEDTSHYAKLIIHNFII